MGSEKKDAPMPLTSLRRPASWFGTLFAGFLPEPYPFDKAFFRAGYTERNNWPI